MTGGPEERLADTATLGGGERRQYRRLAVVAALLYATMPLVVHTEASALQEPFVNLGVLLAVIVWSGRSDGTATSRRLVGAGLLLGVAISMKLVAGVVLVPFLLTGPYARPVADRLRIALAAGAPVAVTSAVFAVLVGWRPLFEQAFEAQVFRGRDGEGLSRVNSLLPFLRGQVGAALFVGPTAWIAVCIFGAMCVGAIWQGGRFGRLWGAMGATILVSLLASPSYYGHYGVLLAPALALVTAWGLSAAFSAAEKRSTVPLLRVLRGVLFVLIVGAIGAIGAIGATQTVTASFKRDRTSPSGSLHRRRAPTTPARRRSDSIGRPRWTGAPRRLRQCAPG